MSATEETIAPQRPAFPHTGENAGLAGISAAELDLMLRAGEHFGETHGLTAAAADACAAGMRSLAGPAGPNAAGLVSARRDEYVRHNGGHFMQMPYYAATRN